MDHTVLPATHAFIHICLCLPSESRSSFSDPGWMVDGVGLGTTKVSKQFAQDVT